MKSILKKDRILVFIALLGLLASLAPLAARTKAEQSNRYYDYILDYSSLRYMASQSTQSEGEWLDRFASLGIRKVTVAEATALGLDASAGYPHPFHDGQGCDGRLRVGVELSGRGHRLDAREHGRERRDHLHRYGGGV